MSFLFNFVSFLYSIIAQLGYDLYKKSFNTLLAEDKMTSISDMASSTEEKHYQVPEWEHNAARQDESTAKPRKSTKTTFSTKLDTIIPPHKRYLGMSRKIFLFILLAVILALIALIIGLAVGLSNSRQALLRHYKHEASLTFSTAANKTYRYPLTANTLLETSPTTKPASAHAEKRMDKTI